MPEHEEAIIDAADSQLTEEKLAIFDILMKPAPEMTADERK